MNKELLQEYYACAPELLFSHLITTSTLSSDANDIPYEKVFMAEKEVFLMDKIDENKYRELFPNYINTKLIITEDLLAQLYYTVAPELRFLFDDLPQRPIESSSDCIGLFRSFFNPKSDAKRSVYIGSEFALLTYDIISNFYDTDKNLMPISRIGYYKVLPVFKDYTHNLSDFEIQKAYNNGNRIKRYAKIIEEINDRT